MKRAVAGLFAVLICFASVEAGHFFSPPRNLFYYRPDMYVYGTRFQYGSSYSYSRSYGRCPTSGSYRSTLPRFHGSHSRRVYQLIINSPAGREVVRANTADLIFEVSPSRALVYIDGKLIGSARNFATERDRYMLIAGEHSLLIEFPGYKSFRTDMQIVPNRTLRLDIALEELPYNSRRQ